MPALLLIVPSQVSRSQQGQSGPKVRAGANLRLEVAEEFTARVSPSQEAESKSNRGQSLNFRSKEQEPSWQLQDRPLGFYRVDSQSGALRLLSVKRLRWNFPLVCVHSRSWEVESQLVTVAIGRQAELLRTH